MTTINPTSGAASGTPSKLIHCQRSGILLAKVEALCSNGWPLLSAPTFEHLIHPAYSFPLGKLIVRYKEQLALAEQAEWCLADRELTELGLTMSATMYAIDCIWQPSIEAAHKQQPSLPCMATIAGSASRLLSLSCWYHYATSKRMSFPLYRISALNNNLGWENFATWLDDAFEIKADWEAGRTQYERDELLKKRTDALLTVKAENVYKRIDFNKVWNWIDIQLVQDGRYSTGRRETFKSIFMKGDVTPEDWLIDDVEDLQLAIIECCDIGNEITFFINTRLNSIKAVIEDFYGSFTLLTHSIDDAHDDCMTLLETEKTNAFFSSFDKKLEALQDSGIELPPAPKRESFASLGLFLKAQAEWNILSRRASLAASKQPTQQPAQQPEQPTGEQA